MAEQFYTIPTDIGKAKIANAGALGAKVEFTDFALGDGDGQYYNPTQSQEKLKNEVWRGPVGQIRIDENNPNWIVLETAIPAIVGGFTIREAGVFDTEGNLLAIGKYPETYKPKLEDGSAKDLYIKMILEVSNTSSVTLKVDPTIILATKKDIDVLSNRIKKNEDDIKELKEGSTVMEDLETQDKTLAGAINELQVTIENIPKITIVDNLTEGGSDKALSAEQGKVLFQSGIERNDELVANLNSKGVTATNTDNLKVNIERVKEIGTDKSGDATAIAGDIIKGKTAYAKGNKLTGTLELTGNVTVADILSGKTFYSNNPKNKQTGTMPNQGQKIYTPGTSNIIIPEGYHNGTGRVNGDSNLISANVRSGASIFGVSGNGNVVNTGDATAVAEDILSGKTAYKGGSKLTGSMANRGAVTNTITMQGGQYTIPVGYHSGSGKVTANFANLVAGNVKKGINVGGVVGTYEEGSSIKSIQRGIVNTRESKMNITISPVDVNNSIVRIYPQGDNYNDGTIFAKTAILRDSTTIEIESYSSYYYDPYYFTYEVIEFKKAKSKQSGLLERKPGIAANTPLSKVNPAKCLVSFSNRASSSSDNSAIDFFVNFTLYAESLQFDFGSDNKSKQYVAWEVLEFD